VVYNFSMTMYEEFKPIDWGVMFNEKCFLCAGTGRYPNGTPVADFCQCAKGIELKRLEEKINVTRIRRRGNRAKLAGNDSL